MIHFILFYFFVIKFKYYLCLCFYLCFIYLCYYLICLKIQINMYSKYNINYYLLNEVFNKLLINDYILNVINFYWIILKNVKSSLPTIQLVTKELLAIINFYNIH